MTLSEKISRVADLLKVTFAGFGVISFVTENDNYVFVISGNCRDCNREQKIEIQIDKVKFKENDIYTNFVQIIQVIENKNNFVPKCGFRCMPCLDNKYKNYFRNGGKFD